MEPITVTCCSALALLLALLPNSLQVSQTGGQDEGSATIRSEDLRAHVEFLASDELQGRSLGSEGIEKAANYLAAQFESMGLEAAGDDGSFLQAMTFTRGSWEALPEMSFSSGDDVTRALVYGADFRLARAGCEGSFKILVLREGDPLPDQAGPHLALCFPERSRGQVSRWLRDAGHPSGAGFGAIVTFLRRPGKATTKLPGSPRLALKPPSGPGPRTLWLELSPGLRGSLSEGEGCEIHVTPHLVQEEFLSWNVIARLPGRGTQARPELAQEAMVLSAHYDHLGVLDTAQVPEDAGPDFDRVYNGADDDASGVATLLEIAAALAAEGPQARELIFLIATAEEVGVIGTTYYLDHPSTPLERTVVNLNFEMLGRPDEQVGGPGRMWLTGAERTNLMEAYGRHDFQIGADPHPEQNFFQRSDNIVFCYRGIVGQTFSSYNLHEDYHHVTDEANTLDYDHLQSCARAGLQAVKLVADGSIDPQWLEGGQPKRRQ